jgi:cation/acetate symporter
MTISIFLGFIILLLGITFYLSSRAKSASGYFVAGGQIHWAVNGIALTGGYLSAASFLGICGMIAFTGLDGYLYSIGFLSGWVVALFVVAEPMRRLGKFTLADALGAKFDNKGIHLACGISTLVISLCYLVPQMVGAGVLMEPLAGIPYHWGVISVGGLVIIIVATAGMTSTTYVQFLKAGLLILFCTIIVVAMCWRGLDTEPPPRNIRGEEVSSDGLGAIRVAGADHSRIVEAVAAEGYSLERTVQEQPGAREWLVLRRQEPPAADSWWRKESLPDGSLLLRQAQHRPEPDFPDLESIPLLGMDEHEDLFTMGRIARLPDGVEPGPVGPIRFLSVFADSETKIDLPRTTVVRDGDRSVRLYYPITVNGNELMRPGGYFDLASESLWPRLDFISLMLALFFGTVALPHVLIRYYTVPDSTAARRSTIVAIAAIGFFYLLTLYLGLGAIVNGVLNPQTTNMTAPLLARSFGEVLFAAISSIAFATVLGTVSGLIVAAAGAVANDLVDRSFGLSSSETGKVLVAKIAATGVGLIAIVLGILMRDMNVGFLVGWAFAVAASANLPAILMVLFWKRTTAQGIIASILVGVISSMGIILMGPDMFEIYGYPRQAAWIPLGQPGIISIPLSFLTIVGVSLLGGKNHRGKESAPVAALDQDNGAN